MFVKNIDSQDNIFPSRTYKLKLVQFYLHQNNILLLKICSCTRQVSIEYEGLCVYSSNYY